MPITQSPDWSWKEIIKCKWYCNTKWEDKLYCWAWCRNTKNISKEQQQEIKKIEEQVYYIWNLELRKEYKKKIDDILDPNTANWKYLKELESHIY